LGVISLLFEKLSPQLWHSLYRVWRKFLTGVPTSCMKEYLCRI